jgi:hypothetical protein
VRGTDVRRPLAEERATLALRTPKESLREEPGATLPERSLEPLEPFRVSPALLLGAERPAPASARPIDETARLLSGELIDSLRVGRLGANGHAVSFRLRRAEGAVGVRLVDEGGALRLRLEGDGADLDALSERVRAELRERGLDVEVELV